MKPGKISSILILLQLFVISACISPKVVPNQPFVGNYPGKYTFIKNSNPILANELGKIPEIQDGISKTDEMVLNQMIDLYMAETKSFENAFAHMYNVGLSNVRKYCTPLQAVFWLIQDGKSESAVNLIQNYSLKTLLDHAWKDLYSWTDHVRWNDFQIVVDRLNSPELLDYYERKVIRYKYLRGFGEDQAEVKRVFKNKYGHCAQITAFTVYILKKAGYEASRKIIIHPALRSPKGNDHRASLFFVNGKKYLMDNGRKNPFGIIRLGDYDPMIHPYLHNYYETWSEMSLN